MINIPTTELVTNGWTPHNYYDNFINQNDYEELLKTFPGDELFKDEFPEERKYGQRPHCRKFFCMGETQGSKYFKQYLTSVNDLPFVWQTLISELRGKEYKEWICKTLNIEDFKIRFDFHRTRAGLDVSPHIDSIGKIGSHLLYFMPKEWQEDWGGETIFYKGKKIDKMNPEPGDFYFHKVESVSGNRSCLFKNSTGGWHGVKEVNAPVDRQICNVVILK